jgi:outer membrane protein assembly factor BamE
MNSMISPTRSPISHSSLWIGLLVTVTVSGCSSFRSAADAVGSFGSVVTPYKVDVVQGNFVSREQVQAIRPGMPKNQVKDILGTPLLVSAFHADRWDYVFTIRRAGQPLQQRKLTVFFKGDLLDKVEADELPSEAEFVSSLDGRRKPGAAPVLQASEESLKEFARQNADKTPSAGQPADMPLAPPIVNYPPLEAPVR